MNARDLVLCLGLTVMAATSCWAEPWRGIVPLKSNRTDVERLLGPSNNNKFATYRLATETVYVEYSPREDEDWNVAPGTVISVSVAPKTIIRLAELGINIRKFEKTRGAQDIAEHFFYVNEREGFSIEVVQGFVRRFIYEPTKKDYQRYRNRTIKRSHSR